MKQTAVDFLFEQLWETPKDKLNWYAILQQAKAMEKEQHWATWGNGVANAENEKLFQDHWNETFGK